jgi:GAF domain-containing protein
MMEKITLEVTDILTPAEVAEVVIETGVNAFGGAAGMVAIVSDDGECLEVIAQHGYPESVVKTLRRLPLQHATPATMVYQRLEPEFIESLDEFRDCYPHLVAMTTGATGTHALLCVPLVIDGRAIGVFGVTYREDRRFSPEERAAAPVFAEQAAQALSRVIQQSARDRAPA